MKLKKLSQILLCLIQLVVISCGSISLKNGTVCSVTSTLQNGMDCAETLTTKTKSIDFDEMVEFLEPNEDEFRAGALCMSTIDWNILKTTLDQACSLLENRCTKKIKKQIESIEGNVNGLKAKGLYHAFGIPAGSVQGNERSRD